MLTFNVVLGCQGLLFRDNLVPRAFPLKNGWKGLGTRLIPRLLVILFYRFFFQSDRLTQYQETHSTLNETLNLFSNAIAIGLELTAPNPGDP